MFRVFIAILVSCPLLFAEQYYLDNMTWHRAFLSEGKVAELDSKEWLKTDDVIEKVGKEWRIKYGGLNDEYATIELVTNSKERMVFIKRGELFRVTISLDFVTSTFIACYEIGTPKSGNQFTIYTGQFRRM